MFVMGAAMVAMALAEPVTVQSLLGEMGQGAYERLLSPANYEYDQASSYDRASVRPGNEEWFANADAGQYVRSEETNGRTEHVMMDVKGPGAVLRVWSANPSGTIRFYVDGEKEPRIEESFQGLFEQGVVPPSTGLCYVSARGYNMYAPIPYAKSLKVTLEGEQANRVYYQIGYRTYPVGTPVVSFDPGRDRKVLEEWGEREPEQEGSEYDQTQRTYLRQADVIDGRGTVLTQQTSGVVRTLTLALEKEKGDWRDVSFGIRLDGETVVATTVGDFFATPGEAVEMRTDFMSVIPISAETGDKYALVNFALKAPMPYERSIQVTVAGVDVGLKGRLMLVEQAMPKLPPLRFYSQTNYHAGPTRPMRDMVVADIKGKGRYIGTSLTVENPVSAWWGEGDEKVFVDGEAFPSIFGTGTEDYFGYAWCDIQTYVKPFHGQPRADGPSNFGHVSNYRWHTWDDIPFDKGLKFDMEMWHWAEADTRYVTTSYWYGEPGKTKITRPDLPELRALIPGKPVEGAIEGEDMEVAEATGGTTEKQGSWIELSKMTQLWWKDAEKGDKLALKFPVEKAGRYRVEAQFCFASDYGRHKIGINGKTLGEYDFFATGLQWQTLDLGIVDLTAGNATFNVECLGQNANAVPRRMFALDYIKLIPVSDP